ncbi:MAG: rRNA methyltransferase [Acidimicrobiaceae bacterium]|nr:rRNA methyltransferase [Acidimicrobiaceae bacterium]
MLIAVNEITDPRIDVFLGLRDKSLRQRREAPGGDLAGIFIAEGDIVIERAIAAGYKLRSVLVDAKRTRPLPNEFDGVDVFAAGEHLLEHIAGYRSYRGALACFYRKEVNTLEDLLADTSMRSLVIVEGINNPTNLGTIMRCAAGLDIDALLLSPDSIDPLSRRCCRVSMGEGFAIPYAWLTDMTEGVGAIKEAGIEVVGMTPRSDATDIDTLEYTNTDRVAVMLGSEGPGLTEAAMSIATRLVRIPMSGTADSLNVGNAAAIAFYGLRQARKR